MKPRRFRVCVGVLAVVAALFAARAVPANEPTRRTVSEWERDLRDASVDVRARAAQALSAYQARAIAPLTAGLNDKEYRVRASAAESLVKIGPGPVIPSMIKALDSPDVPIRANAAVVLGAFGPDAQPAVPALARALKDQNLRVRELAGEALNRIAATGPAGAVTFPLNCH